MNDHLASAYSRFSMLTFRLYTQFIRWAFARFYREFAWTYDAVAALVSGGHWRDWALAAVPYLRGNVLELGCGTGNLQRALAERAAQLPSVGLDASPQMLNLARRKIKRARLVPHLINGDARALPFPPAIFDTLVATFPSEYIVAPTTLAEARRVLRPGGRFVIVPSARFTVDGLYHQLVDLAYRATLQASPRRAPPPGQPVAISPTALSPIERRLEHELARAGFQVETTWVAAPGGLVELVIGTLEAGAHHER